MKHLLAVEAGAGSGKTFTLAVRYISLLLHGADPKEILAITFTNKASLEIEERIIKFLRLPEWSAEIPEIERQKILEGIGQVANLSPKQVWKQLLSGKVLEKVLNSPIHISTIDSFIHRIIRKFGYFEGIDPTFKVVENLDNRQLKELFFKRLDLNSLRRILFQIESRHLVEALHSLYIRINEVEPLLEQFLKQPFPSGEFEEKLHRLEEVEEWIFNGLRTKKVNLTIIKKYLDGDLETYLRRWGKGNYASLEEWEAQVGEYYQLKREVETLLELKELQLWGRFLNLYRQSRKELGQKLGEHTFEDIGVGAYQLLHRHLDREFFYFRLDSRFSHILIDEFQDTSTLQWKILEPLVEEIKGGIGTGDQLKTFFYVGDPKQAIYQWRGGKVRLFYHLKKTLKPFGLQIDQLDTNYRSGEKIVKFINQLFGLNQKWVKKGGYVEVKEVNPDRLEEEVVELVLKLGKMGVRWTDIALLVRKNNMISRFQELLEEKGIPVLTSTTRLLIHQPIARGVIGLLKYLYLRRVKHLKEKESHHSQLPTKFYLLQFETIIGRKVTEEEFSYINGSSPAHLIQQVMEKFNLYQRELLELWEVSLKFPTLTHFYYQIDREERELESGELVGVNILTIHKSKGLEFPFVIVTEFENSRSISRLAEKFILGYRHRCTNSNSKGCIQLEGDILRKNFGKSSFQFELDKEYRNLHMEAVETKKLEEFNLEYVAFTRAQQGLFIFKYPQKSNFQSQLEPGQWGELEKEVGKNLEKIGKRNRSEESDRLEGVEKREGLERGQENRSNRYMSNWEGIGEEESFQETCQKEKSGIEKIENSEILKPIFITPRPYGRQEVMEAEEGGEVDIKAVRWGNALHYGLELESVEGVRNRFGLYLSDNRWEEILKESLERLHSQFPGIWKKELAFKWKGREYRADLLVLPEDFHFSQFKEKKELNQFFKGKVENIDNFQFGHPLTPDNLSGKLGTDSRQSITDNPPIDNQSTTNNYLNSNRQSDFNQISDHLPKTNSATIQPETTKAISATKPIPNQLQSGTLQSNQFRSGEGRYLSNQPIIVDYKSSLNPEFMEKYQRQLELYRDAIYHLLKLPIPPKTVLFSIISSKKNRD